MYECQQCHKPCPPVQILYPAELQKVLLALQMNHEDFQRTDVCESGFLKHRQSRGFLWFCRLGSGQYAGSIRCLQPLFCTSTGLMGFTVLLSILMSWKSVSSLNSFNIVSNSPSSCHYIKRMYTAPQAPYRSGRSLHAAPLRTIHSIPLRIGRSSFISHPF